MRRHRFPITTIIVLAVTAIITGLQFVYPPLLLALERTPTAIAQHQWWRLVTPMFIHPEGLRQIAIDFPAVLVLGIWVERRFGTKHWLILYFVSGFIGEISAYAWKPFGGGASLPGAGLLGAL